MEKIPFEVIVEKAEEFFDKRAENKVKVAEFDSNHPIYWIWAGVIKLRDEFLNVRALSTPEAIRAGCIFVDFVKKLWNLLTLLIDTEKNEMIQDAFGEQNNYIATAEVVGDKLEIYVEKR